MPLLIKHAVSGQRLVCLTAYNYLSALRVAPHADVILVGDSQGMVLHGLPSTVHVSLEMMRASAESVARALLTLDKKPLLLVDLPFGSYEESPAQAFASAALLLKAGAAAVKLEGGAAMVETVRFLSQRGVPVCAHLGLTPQHINTLGGYKVQGRGAAGDLLVADATAHAAAGAFAVLLEAVPAPLAAQITRALTLPTIGIGAGKDCDGQVLVTEDLLGLSAGKPAKFVKRYAELGRDIDTALGAFAAEVRSGAYPSAAHCYS
jgi:3-methyl-2-oxobutanoate hydroxymethyltransferase